MDTASHTAYMLQALDLAARGRLTTSPNPMVGCVIVKNNRVIGSGFHLRAGGHHAEVNALQEAGEEAQGATAYVTLEPCNHHGRTPPCTDALIRAGIKKVYVAVQDPNPLVAGQGMAKLREHNIEVVVGVCEAEAKKLNEIFFHYIVSKRPFVIAKWAMSLDGKTITHPHDSRQISGEHSQQHTHHIRQHVDAILVGAKTALKDNPLLTARPHGAAEIKHPVRVILTSNGQLPHDLKVFSADLPGKTIIATTNKVDKDFHHRVKAEILVLPCDGQGKVSLPALLDELGAREITSLLVEGGMSVHENFFKEKLVNKVKVYIAPVIIGALEKKARMKNLEFSPLGDDFHFSADCMTHAENQDV